MSGRTRRSRLIPASPWPSDVPYFRYRPDEAQLFYPGDLWAFLKRKVAETMAQRLPPSGDATTD